MTKAFGVSATVGMMVLVGCTAAGDPSIDGESAEEALPSRDRSFSAPARENEPTTDAATLPEKRKAQPPGSDGGAPDGSASPDVPAGCNAGSIQAAHKGCYRATTAAVRTLTLSPASAGAAATLACPPDHLAVGFFGGEGDVLDHVGLVCQRLSLDGTMQGPRVDVGPAIGGNGGRAARGTCEEGLAAIGYTLAWSGGYVDRVTVQCNRPTYRVQPMGTDPGSRAAGPLGGKGGQRTPTEFCGDAQFMRAINVVAGTYGPFRFAVPVTGSFGGTCGVVSKTAS